MQPSLDKIGARPREGNGILRNAVSRTSRFGVALLGAIAFSGWVPSALAAKHPPSLRVYAGPCLAQIIDWEHSGWSPTATNRKSGAYGLPQALPGSKMKSAGDDWATNPYTQIRWMRHYVNGRYGGCWNALSFWRSNQWY